MNKSLFTLMLASILICLGNINITISILIVVMFLFRHSGGKIIGLEIGVVEKGSNYDEITDFTNSLASTIKFWNDNLMVFHRSKPVILDNGLVEAAYGRLLRK